MNNKAMHHSATMLVFPDSKVHGANMGPTWVLPAPDGSHAGPMNLAIRVVTLLHVSIADLQVQECGFWAGSPPLVPEWHELRGSLGHQDTATGADVTSAVLRPGWGPRTRQLHHGKPYTIFQFDSNHLAILGQRQVKSLSK